MAQFGWPTLIKTAAITAIVTSGLWVSAGLIWYYRSGPGQAASMSQVGTEPAVAVLSHDGPPVMPQGAAGKGGALIKASAVAAAAPVAFTDPGTLIIPVAGVRPGDLVDTFTQSRSGGRVHDAIDIMAPRGTPVVAVAAGRVEKLFLSNLGGITAYLRSPDRRTIYYYAHLEGYAPGLAEGQDLAAGASVGTVGATGNASPDGPHLHFAILATRPDRAWYQPSTAVNPYPLLTRAGR